MTLREYLIHLWCWLRTFPRWHTNEHTFVGRVNGGVYHCLLCEREQEEYEEEAEIEGEYDDRAYLARASRRDSED